MIPFEIGNLDRSVRVERSLISVETCSCGQTRDRTLGWSAARWPLRGQEQPQQTRLFATGLNCSGRDATVCDWARLDATVKCETGQAVQNRRSRLGATGRDCEV
ncbi:hypothetical protein CRG98_021247 [Punica granatum]|uniref:Uncharacterized protein n=1 Tax=Punica granatum TaxID=22663 RepID=A0A2I0JQ03_PUNGR|nr:hypothetical protein CRG98_021247 [Punica granatum]